MQVGSEQPDAIRIVIREREPSLAAKILRTISVALCLALLAALCIVAVPRFFGVHEFNVTSSSMSPAYPVGTLVFTAPTDPASIRPGEVVSFVMNERLDVATHRVVENDRESGHIVTKGDANANNDEPILYGNVLGVVRFSIPMVGSVADHLTNDPVGRLTGIALVGGIVILVVALEAAGSRLSRTGAQAPVASAAKVEKASRRGGR